MSGGHAGRQAVKRLADEAGASQSDGGWKGGKAQMGTRNKAAAAIKRIAG